MQVRRVERRVRSVGGRVSRMAVECNGRCEECWNVGISGARGRRFGLILLQLLPDSDRGRNNGNHQQNNQSCSTIVDKEHQ